MGSIRKIVIPPSSELAVGANKVTEIKEIFAQDGSIWYFVYFSNSNLIRKINSRFVVDVYEEEDLK